MIIDEENNNIFIVEKLNSLKNELNRDQVNLKSVQRDIKELEDYDNASQFEYLNALLDPINKKGIKIPSGNPLPSCSFQMHNTIDFSPTATGFDVFCLNPWFLASEKVKDKEIKIASNTYYLNSNVGLYFFNNQASLNTGTPDKKWYFPRGFSQCIPDVYNSYRLVSACVEVRYTGRLDEAKGIIGGGIDYLKSNYVGFRVASEAGGDPSWGSANPDCEKYTNFEYIRDCFYSQENSALEGLRMLYFPLDNSFEEFKKVWDGEMELDIQPGSLLVGKIKDKYFKSGFNWFVYGIGLPYTATRNFRVDYYLNFECLPKAEFLNYMPVTLNVKPCLTNGLKKKFVEEVQGKALQKLNIY